MVGRFARAIVNFPDITQAHVWPLVGVHLHVGGANVLQQMFVHKRGAEGFWIDDPLDRLCLTLQVAV
jgi:hypothetical protein